MHCYARCKMRVLLRVYTRASEKPHKQKTGSVDRREHKFLMCQISSNNNHTLLMCVSLHRLLVSNSLYKYDVMNVDIF